MKKVTIGDLSEFDHSRFNDAYRSLIDVGLIAQQEQKMLGVLGFLNELESLIENIKQDYAAEQDETRNQTEKERELLTENAKMKAEMKQLREWVKELLPENLKEKPNPSKMKVSK
ncbi:hypothetical protein SAMN05444280_108132 [Tangfeifania diversioriginum]|uniref:Uncharacterized protein n=1 Tax=Tangfeifania diversioriginum TaxID=1168035 RepID=A0A1M6FDM8_9BACT|nr:hypothetical protein [Tangfeifania diversioriginum]SHI95840.1 hypothetical protein SAMN05444280_108132 [Tangfeifania diversioriginum]